jgi:HK97 family phage major capsid protein
MKSVKELMEQRAVIKEQMRDIVRNAEKEGRDVLSKEEDQRFKKFDEDYEGLSEQINTAKKIESLTAETATQKGNRIDTPIEMTPEQRKAAQDKAFWKFMRHGAQSLEQDERMLLTKGTSTQITVTDSLGGYLVPTGFSNELERRMKYYGGMLEACRTLPTATGETIEWPTVDDTATTGALTSESSPSIAVSDVTIGQKLLNAYTYDSGIMKVSVQLLQDSFFDLENEVQGFFAERLGRKLNADLTTADGSDKPNGVVTAVTAASGLYTAADDVTISRNDLLNIQHQVDRAYRPNGAYMFNDSTLLAIKKLSLGSSDARPLWVPSMREGAPDQIEGFNYYINNDMADIAAGAVSVLFGDFQKYIIRIVQDMVMVPLREKYMDALQVGYISYMRADGELVQNAAIKGLRHPNT